MLADVYFRLGLDWVANLLRKESFVQHQLVCFLIIKRLNAWSYWNCGCLQKGEFIGRDALLRQREEGVKRMYVQLLLQDHDSDLELWAWGGEPIYRDNKYVGSTTTTGYGFTLRRMVRKL